MQKAQDRFLVLVRVVSELLFAYGLLGWAYGVLVQITHPEWLTIRLSHLTTWLRLDTFAIASFIISALGFLLWRLSKESARST